MNQPQVKQIEIADDKFGKNVSVISPVNLYRFVIVNGVFIEPFVKIQKGVKIGDWTKIQSHSFLCELFDVGKN